MADSATIFTTSDATFEQDVMQRSQSVPVIVDFWAEWCQPCRMLAPALEQAVNESGGRVVLAKARTDDCPQWAQQMQVQSIPAVFAVVEGQIADYFVGVLPPEQLRHWLDRIISQGALLDARGRESSDPEGAAAEYRHILETNPNETRATIGLARLALEQDRHDEARQWIAQLEERGFLEPEAEKIKARLELDEFDAADLADCRAAAAAKPQDLEAQLQLAQALAAANQYEESLQVSLAIVQQQKQGPGESARQLMVDIFRVLPDDSELVRDYRRRLATALY